MRSDLRPAGLGTGLAAAAALVATLLAILIPRWQHGPPVNLLDVAVTATVAACSVRLLAYRRHAWAAVYAVAACAWTAVGLAPLLPMGLEEPVSRLVLVPHAVLVASMAAVVAGHQRRWWGSCAGIAILGATGWRLPALALLGGVLLVAVAVRRRAPHQIVVAAVALGLILVSLDQRVLGDNLSPQLLVAAVDAALIAAAALVTHSLTEDRLARGGFQPTDEPEDLTRWLARALNTPSLAVAFPDGDGSTVDLVGKPAECPPIATSVQDLDGDVVAWLNTAQPDDPLLRRSLVTLLGSLGSLARMRRRQLAQATDLAASRRRLQEAADEESRSLERQLERSVVARLDAMRDQLAGSAFGGLVARIDEVRDELRRHARGLDPLAGRTLAQALAVHVERGVTVSVDPSVTDPALACTAWYVATEALNNAAKHAPGAVVTVAVQAVPGAVDVVVTDHGPGGADPAGPGLLGLADRVEAAGGTLAITSSSSGTRVAARLADPGNPSLIEGLPGSREAAASLGSMP